MMSPELKPVKPPAVEILLVTGMSGAGKSTASHALEDLGWYVVDNLPPQLFLTMADLVSKNTESEMRLALVVDVRTPEFFEELQESIASLRTNGAELRVLFLDADDDVLVRRFEAGRRPHPLQGRGRILQGLHKERELLADIRKSAELVLDTTDFNVHDLTAATAELFDEDGPVILRLNVMSFGFKYGVPADANFVADVRFIANPHWVPELRAFTGEDKAVSDFVKSQRGVEEFINHYVNALKPVLEGYRRENKHYATFAVGCTGGKHRSVAISTELAHRLSQTPGATVNLTHRDMGRE